MGDRVSIQFVKVDKHRKCYDKSVVLFNHWGGMGFVAEAKRYVKKLKKEVGDREMFPLDRLEPDTVMVDFIRHLTKNMKRVESNLYLGATENDGDNSDNGHFEINLDKEK